MNKFLKVPQAIAFAFLFATSIFAQAVWNGKIDTGWYDESKNDFTITTPQQLAGLAELVNEGENFKGKTVRLGVNIMLNDTANLRNWASRAPANVWTPIGTKDSTKMFYGTFDGNGYVISGVYINSAEDRRGLFRNLAAGGTIKNLGVSSSYIKGSEVIGGLVGTNFGSISNSYFVGTVIGDFIVGGLVGYNDKEISNSYSVSLVTGKKWVGNLVGDNDGLINNSYALGSVKGNNVISGLAGANQNSGTISNSYFMGIVIGKEYVAGLTFNNYGKLNNSYYDMQIIGPSLSFSESDFRDGKLTMAMKQKNTFVGWDFNKIWGIDSKINCGYPYLLENKGKSFNNCPPQVSQDHKRPAPNDNGTCSIALRDYFLKIVRSSDVPKLHKELVESMSYFEDKPKFDIERFVKSCLCIHRANYGYDNYELLNQLIINSDADMFLYVLRATRSATQSFASTALEVFEKKKTDKAAEIIKILQKNGANIVQSVEQYIKTGNLDMIKLLHEKGIDLQGIHISSNPIDLAANHSNKIHQYLKEQDYKTIQELNAIAAKKKAEEKAIAAKAEAERQRINSEQRQEQWMRQREQTNEEIKENIKNITALLKANKLGECFKMCDLYSSFGNEPLNATARAISIFETTDSLLKIHSNLCEKQLVAKIRKLPKNKVTPALANIYYNCENDDKCVEIIGKVIQNDGKMILVSTIPYNEIVMVQISGYIGDCAPMLKRNNMAVGFDGFAKYLGDVTYTTVGKARQTVENYQLLWCGGDYDD